MDNPFKKFRNLINDIRRYPTHLRWNREAVEGGNRNDEIIGNLFSPTLPDEFKTQDFYSYTKKFTNWLREIQQIVSYSGYKPGLTYIADPLYNFKEGYSLIGMIYPVDGIVSGIFYQHLKYGLGDYCFYMEDLHSAIDIISSGFMAQVVHDYTRYYEPNRMEYRFVVFYLGPQYQFEVKQNDEHQNNIDLDPIMLNSINYELHSAFDQLTPGIFKVGDDPIEA